MSHEAGIYKWGRDSVRNRCPQRALSIGKRSVKNVKRLRRISDAARQIDMILTSRFKSGFDRRQFLAAMGMGGLFYTTPGAFAQALVLTPEQTIGPYYPDKMPLDLDNDLLVINDNITPAIWQIAWITERILDQTGQPVRGALAEIWQADNNGAYIHSASPIANRDANFQGYGRFLTGSSGEDLFRTVKPGLYPGRTRHVHFSVTAPGGPQFT